MYNIKIKDAINFGSWFKCTRTITYFSPNVQIECRFKVNSLQKVNIKELQQPEEVSSKFDMTQADFWYLQYEVVNMSKTSLTHNYFTDSLHIMDQDGFEFENIFDEYICKHSLLGQEVGFNKYGASGSFSPKIKYSGSLLYFLPKEEDVEYYLLYKDGEVCEI